MHSTNVDTQAQASTGYVEYSDMFSRSDVVPSAAIKDSLLLFDTFDNRNPLSFLYYQESKIYQKLTLVVTQGDLTLEINGKKTKVEAPALVTIMPENMTRVISTSYDFNYFMFVFYPKLTSAVYKDLDLTYSNARMSLRHFITTLTQEQMTRMRALYNDIKQDILSPDYQFKQSYIQSLLNILEVSVINIHKEFPIPLQGDSSSKQYNVYSTFLSLLNKHSAEHRTVQYYADLMDISNKYLSFVCISYSKKNASSWIDESVIQRAKAFLVVHHYSFTDTARALNFPNISSFSRFFKRVTGQTPKDFVKSQKS